MQLETALRVFGLHPNPTTDELNRAFRRLAKRYHPDSNADRVEWATSHMTSINVAYETIRKSIENGDAQRSHDTATNGTQGSQGKSGTQAEPSGGTRSDTTQRCQQQQRSTAGRHGEYSTRTATAPGNLALREFGDARHRVMDGIGVYYQFGLENFRLRYDGPHRLKYRKATRLVMKGLDRFAELWTRHGPVAEQHPVSRFYTFASLFYRSMFLEHGTNPYATKYNRNAYQHYRYGSALLDETIRDTLFPELGGRSASDPFGNLQVAWREFSAVIGRYPESDFFEESRLKRSLTEAYMDFLGS